MLFRSLSVAALLVAAGLAGGARAQTADLSGLHDALHLSAGQEEAWRGYVAAIAPDPSLQARHRSAAMMMTTLPTPRRVDLINAEMEEDLASVRRQGRAVDTFYAMLTPDQQRTFDHQTMRQGGGSNGAGGSTLHQPAQGQPLPQPRQP